MPFYLKFPQNSINSRIGVVHKKTGSENTLPGICLLFRVIGTFTDSDLYFMTTTRDLRYVYGNRNS